MRVYCANAKRDVICHRMIFLFVYGYVQGENEQSSSVSSETANKYTK
jgi:hypothetical protein